MHYLSETIGPYVAKAKEAGACAVWVRRLEDDPTRTLKELILAYPDFVGMLAGWYETHVEELPFNPQALIYFAQAEFNAELGQAVTDARAIEQAERDKAWLRRFGLRTDN